MTYQALYRVYRPQRFDEIVGQEVITKTLKHAIEEQKTSHAYLFTGPRGTGKTSAAKIFAKAINCPNQEDGEPCNQCEICDQITKGALNDVIEIDAASNNGVEEIRDIREKANYAPTQAEYKIYIVDEVHMLSQGAFNALLKTLEEPPEKVVFILATTEPHKIPLTIISRTQRFDFKRINDRAMVSRMADVLDQEAVDYDPEVLEVISRSAEGGMRDALSALDQTLSFAQDRLSVDDAMQVTGAFTQDLLQDYIESLFDQATEKGLSILQEIIAEGKDPARFVEDVILFARDLLIFQQEEVEASLLKRAQVTDRFKTMAKEIDVEFLYEAIRVFNETQHEMRLTNHAIVYLEVATVRLSQEHVSQPQQEMTSDVTVAEPVSHDIVSQLEDQIKTLQKQIQSMDKSGSRPVSAQKKVGSPPAKKGSGKVVFKVNKAQVFQVLSEATRKDLHDIQGVWPDLLDNLSVTSRALTRQSQPVAASPDGAVISFEYDILCQKASEDLALQEEIADFLEKVLDKKLRLVYVTEADWPGVRQAFIDQMKTGGQKSASSHELVQEADEENQMEDEASQDVVDQALEMFGEDFVNIKDE